VSGEVGESRPVESAAPVVDETSTEPFLEAAEGITPEAAEGPVRWWHRIAVSGWSRSLLLIAGLALLVVGVIDAWRSEASTTLLIVGGLFVLFAVVVGQDWEEIRLSHGGMTAQIFRRFGEALEQVEQSPDAEIRAQVAELRTEVDRMAERRPVITHPPFRTRVSETSSPVVGPGIWGGRPVAFHTFGPSWVKLSLSVPPRDTGHRYTCAIVHPDGRETSMKSIRPPLLRGVPWTFSTVFPDEFVGSSPLVPGSYKVEWRQGVVSDSPPESRVSSLAALLAQKMMLSRLALVATDAFTIRDAAPGERDVTGAAEESGEPTNSQD
jgi:hypothetical protein